MTVLPPHAPLGEAINLILVWLYRSGRRAQSLEQLDDNSGSKGAGSIGGVVEEGIPKGTPKSTPKLGRHSLGEKIHSESDLQNAGMFVCVCCECVYVCTCICVCMCALVCIRVMSVSVCIARVCIPQVCVV